MISGESPALDVIKILNEKGADLAYSDPFVPSFKDGSLELASVELTAESLAGFDCAVIATAHSTFDYEMIVSAGIPLVDARNALKGIKADHITRI